MVSGIKRRFMGNADVISHFIVWDVFLIKDRIPYFISGQSVPNVPIDVEEMNKEQLNMQDLVFQKKNY